MENLTTFKIMSTTPNMAQRVATRTNRVAKRTQHVAPSDTAIASKCCDRLAGITQLLTNKFMYKSHTFLCLTCSQLLNYF